MFAAPGGDLAFAFVLALAFAAVVTLSTSGLAHIDEQLVVQTTEPSGNG